MVAGKIVVVLLVFYAVFANAIVATEHEDEILIAGRNHEKRVHVEEHALDVRKEAIKWLSTFFGEEFAQFYFDFFCTMSFFISYMAFCWFCIFSRCVRSNKRCPECPDTKNIAELSV